MEYAKKITEKISNLFSKSDSSEIIASPDPDDVLDICFLMDITGSMGSYITLMRKCLNDLVYYFSSTFAPQKVYMSFVGYRDFGDPDQFETEDFAQIDMNNVLQSKLYKKIEGIQVSGGGDYPEDIRGGIKTALKLKWKSVNKIIVLIADAPTHGKRYCDQNAGDGYPNEDIQDAIEELMKRGIGFLGIEFLPGTDQMYQEITQIYKEKSMEVYFALENMKDLQNERLEEDLKVRRFMDLIGTKIKATIYKIIKANR